MNNIEVLLTENIEGTGIVGDVVKVKPGFARNYLLPRGMATRPTAGAVAALAERRKEVELEMALKRKEMEKVLEKLEGFEITLERAHNEQGVLFGGVSQHDISQALQAEGLPVEDRAVRIGVTIKRLDSYEIPIVLAADLKTTIKLWVVSDRAAEDLDDGQSEKAADEVETVAAEADE